MYVMIVDNPGCSIDTEKRVQYGKFVQLVVECDRARRPDMIPIVSLRSRARSTTSKPRSLPYQGEH